MTKCPECGSEDVLGSIAAFWVGLDKNGEAVGDWNDWQGNTELSDERHCNDCGHEWIAEE